MAFDLGFDHLDRQSVNASIEKLEVTFDLILIADYFKESMILLRKELCWSMEDVVFFSNNARSTKTPIGNSLASKMRNWNFFDSAIFNHVNETFWKKVAAHKNFEEELEE